MSRRFGHTNTVKRYPFDLHVRISSETKEAIERYIKANPGLNLNKSDVTDQALSAFFRGQNYWSDIAKRLDLTKKEIIRSRQTVEKLTEILLHFVRTYFYYAETTPDREATLRGEKFYRGFVKALNRLLKTHSYVSQLYTDDFEAALEEEEDSSRARSDRVADPAEELRNWRQ